MKHLVDYVWMTKRDGKLEKVVVADIVKKMNAGYSQRFPDPEPIDPPPAEPKPVEAKENK